MRKIVNTVLALLMVLCLSACSLTPDTQGQTASTDETTGTTNVDESRSDVESNVTDKQDSEMPAIEQGVTAMENSIYTDKNGEIAVIPNQFRVSEKEDEQTVSTGLVLLCCGVLVSMVGCGGNTAPPPTESPPQTESETIITETNIETTPPVTAVKPTEKEKEPTPTESADQATGPIVTATEPTTTAKPVEESKPTATPKPTEPSAAENTEPIEKTSSETEEPQEEIYVGIQWPEVDPADIERLVIEKINAYRIAQGDTAATMLPGLTEAARYRATELSTNFEHRGGQQVSTELKYGQYVDLAPYGMPDDSYYKGYSREAIGMGDWFGTAESMSDRISDGFHHSKGHWSYVGSSKYPYIAVGVTKANGKWYVCICMSEENYGG